MSHKIDLEESNKNKMMKLLGLNRNLNEQKPEHKIKLIKPEPPPLPNEFQESVFEASK